MNATTISNLQFWKVEKTTKHFSKNKYLKYNYWSSVGFLKCLQLYNWFRLRLILYKNILDGAIPTKCLYIYMEVKDPV